MTSCQCVVRKHELQGSSLPAAICSNCPNCQSLCHKFIYDFISKRQELHTRKITVHLSRIWHDGGKDAWAMLQMTQLKSIRWTRPSFLPADAIFLGCARAVVQLLLQHIVCRYNISFTQTVPFIVQASMSYTFAQIVPFIVKSARIRLTSDCTCAILIWVSKLRTHLDELMSSSFHPSC